MYHVFIVLAYHRAYLDFLHIFYMLPLLMTDSRAIGVFDSGFGGLTILSAIHQALPYESTVYLGDTARLPYGTKSPETVRRYALNNAKALLAVAPLKMLVVACNTVSAVALEALQDALSIPVVGVIEPGARAAMLAHKTDSIAVLATAATVQSKAYEITLRKQGFLGDVTSRACPLFVPLVEEGLVSGPIATQIAHLYLDKLPTHVDTIILGCTHYPLLLPTLECVLPKTKHWINSAHEVALEVKRLVGESQKREVSRRYLVTDAPHRFEQISAYYLGSPVSAGQVELIDI